MYLWASWDILQENTPERFWFTEAKAAQYREWLVKWASEWMFLYEWTDQYDTTGTETGGSYYDRVVHSPWYGVSDVESMILGKMDKTRKSCSRKKNHIEFGVSPGKANKFKNVIYPHFSQNKPYKHIDVDSSWSLINLCRNEYEVDWNQLVEFTWIQTDWRKKWVIDHIDDKVYYRLWWSIGNFSEDQVIEILRNLSSDSQFVGRDIIIWHFLRPEEPDKQQKIDQLEEQYSWPEVQEWIMKGFVALGLDTTKLAFTVEYEPWISSPDRIKVGAKLLEDMEIDIWWGEYVVKHAGEHIWAIRSRRYTKEQFWFLAEKAWCSLQESFTADDASMAVSVLKTPRKSFSLQTKLASAIGGSLLLLFGGMDLGKMAENQKRQKIKNNATEEIFLWNKDLSVDAFNSQVTHVLYDLEYVYGNKLSEEKKYILEWLIQDFLIKQKHYFSYLSHWWMGQVYNTDLYTPTFLHKFIATYKQTLLSMQIKLVPYDHLVKHQEALQNSYFYDWDRLEFSDSDVDDEIWDYVHYTGITHVNGVYEKPQYWHYACGIKNIWWKPYFVLKTAWSEWFILQPKSAYLRSQWVLCSGDVVSEIIWRGEVSILAEKIRLFLGDKYWTEKHSSVVMNWQDRIAAYILDLYAEGWDLSFLVSDYAKDYPYRWFHEELLEKFIHSYILPNCQTDLQDYHEWYWRDRMHNIDWKKIESDRNLVANYSFYVDAYYDFLCSYLPDLCLWNPSWAIKSSLLKLFLVWEKNHTNYSKPKVTIEQTLEDPQMMRAWVTKHRADFIKAWIEIPDYPVAMEELITTWKRGKCIYRPTDAFEKISGKDAMSNPYLSEDLWLYTDINWNKYLIWVNRGHFFSPSHFVARMDRAHQDEQLLQDRKDWKYWKVYSSSDGEPFLPKTLLTDTNEETKKGLLYELRNKVFFFSSHDMHLIVNDFKQWMEAMKKLEE